MRLGFKRKNTAMFFIISLLCLVVLIYFLHKFLKRAEPVFIAQSSNYSNTAFTDLVNECIINIVKKEEFSVFFKSNSVNGLSILEADTSKLNLVISQLLIDIQNALNSDYPAKIYIPLGSLTDYYLFSSTGPSIPVKIVPISIVNCKIEDKTESVGINQVYHTIYLDLWVDMRYCGFMLDEKERISATVPLAQALITGDVPQYYGGDAILPDK